MSIRGALRALAKPKIILPILLAGALFFLAVSLGDIGKVLGRIRAIPLVDLGITLGCAFVYLVFKGLQLHLLLGDLGAHPKRRRFLLAFAVGELAVTFPLGIFAQNWVLSESERIHFGRSSAATVVMLLMETAVVLLWLTVVGIPNWPPLRPLAGCLLLLIAALVFGVLHFEPVAQKLAGKVRHEKLHKAMDEAIGLIRGLKRLAGWRVLWANFLITAVYLGALIAAFLAVGHGVGLDKLSYVQAATIYCFSLAAVLLTGGLSGQIGTIEVIGMNAARGWGIGYTDGLALMLGFRVAWTGAMWLLNGPVVIAFWRRLRGSRKRRRERSKHREA
ncbi:MAG TPA: lysylphosphatidylglycerol synthase domain-containing protein [Rhodanobacteraceae bacterium]|nr:lysylphosphatidylglycerol synthase domain-containing protein [Rhodanobacteraceae bacterium]